MNMTNTQPTVLSWMYKCMICLVCLWGVGISFDAMAQSTAGANSLTPNEGVYLADPTNDPLTKNNFNNTPQGSVQNDSTKRSNQASLDAPIDYVASDSLVLFNDGTAYMYGSSDVKYSGMELTSERIRICMDSSTLHAYGVYDSINEEWVGKPIFKDSKDSYESDELTYNLKSQKGFIRGVISEQGEGYVVAEKAKKTNTGEMMMAGGRYTTCDQHDHPHFYLKMTKAKVNPGKNIATGPAYMVLGDVPVPLAIPFGFFPFTDTYSSGLIMPTFGDDYTRGLYLRGIGYYFAINDYMDMEVTGDIYTKGTWAVYATTRYVKRYRFRGNLSINYRSDVTGEKGMPDYSQARNLSVVWTHQQDAKANPYSNFSASVNFSTSGYNRSNINSYYNPQLNSENTKSSSISYTQRFPNSPWSLSMSALISQQTKDSTLSLTLPDLSINMSSIYPFKRKHGVGKEKWYEKIRLSYSANAKIAINRVKEDKLFKSNFLRDWQTGMQHSMPISATWTAFKYINITPNISLKDRMYFQRIDQSWDEANQVIQRDTTNGFYNVFDFNVGVSMQTKLYGFYTPIRKLFPKGKVEKIRHVMTPSLSFSYHPDFGASGWGYYGQFNQPVLTDSIDPETGKRTPKMDAMGQPMFIQQNYSRFPNGMYGNATKGLAANLGFSLQNNIEMKIRNDKDTTGNEPFKVISLIDNLGISGAYNFAADSMNWSNFTVNLRIKIPVVNYTLNLSGQFDPYMYELNAFGQPMRTNKQYWHHGKFPLFLGTGTSLSYTFNNDVIKKWFKKKDKNNSTDETDETNDTNMENIEVNADGSMSNGKLRRGEEKKTSQEGFVKTEIPWSITVSYNVRYAQGREFDYEKMYYKMQFTQNLSLSGSIGFGSGWKVSTSTSFDITNKKWATTSFNISRDLHCWNMSASFVPFGPYKSYTFHIGVNASMLKDLKYDKSSTDSTNKRVTWW